MSELAKELQRRQKNKEQFSALLEGYNALMAAHQEQQASISNRLQEFTEEFERLSNSEAQTSEQLDLLKEAAETLSLAIGKLERAHASHTERQAEIFALMESTHQNFEASVQRLKVMLTAALGVGFIWFVTLGVLISAAAE